MRKYFVKTVSIMLALLFIYAAASKLLDFENFQVQLAQSPLLSAYAGIISYLILIIEFAVAIALCLQGSRLIALYGSLALMVSFTIYIYLILNYSDFIPCSCGGILEKLGWKEHLIFNICFVLLSLAAIIVLSRTQGYRIWRTLGMSTAVTALSCGVIILLFLGSEHVIKKENNFTRRFLNHPVIEEKKILDLDNQNYYFAGYDVTHIYLGNRIYPQKLLTVDTALANENLTHIVADNMNYKFSNVRLQVLAPYYYFYDGTIPVIFRGRLGDTAAKTISFEDAYFNQLVVLDSSRFALRTQSSATKEFTMALLDLNSDAKVKLYPQILEKQYDGVFDVDGNFNFDRRLKNLIYTYLYRNQFIVMDQQFTIKNKLNTIDTTRTAQIKITKLADGRRKMNAPPIKVNRQTSAYAGLLFNQSDLMGKLESREAWKDAKVVDIYRTDRQEYIGSFYIYNKKDMKMRDFIITGNYMYVLRDAEVVRYRIRDIIKKNYMRGEAENL
ncbi:DoxX family protein [Chryseobacterium camelliae]|uniref:DoxX family protein n=1 Tax=Chryseobacterium camelliae TaxID=1265445 RepID=UPI002863E6C1|nr:MauE/DoxX family redox-associated membrane protein [Chryseobacterium camelliae]MDR6513717.1 putative membrane protein YphA (DoxX/SURF4 family) [Chryseobacterium camelliae]